MLTKSYTERHPTELAALRGARLVTAVETESGKGWAEAKIKQLTGGDPITARRMREDFFIYDPQFILIIAGNHKRKFFAVNEAMRRRILLYPFHIKISKEEMIKNLEQKLVVEEGGAILYSLIQACLAWQQRGLDTPLAARLATDEYLNAEDTLGNFFEDECEKGFGKDGKGDGKVYTLRLYNRYKDWADARGELRMSMRQFSTQFEEKGSKLGFRKTKGNIVIEPDGKPASGFVGLSIRELRDVNS